MQMPSTRACTPTNPSRAAEPERGHGRNTMQGRLLGADFAAGEAMLRPPVQAADGDLGRGRDPKDVAGLAATATRGGGAPMPHLARIQAAFGKHDVGGVKAHQGDGAAAATKAMGARAFASGNRIGFGGAPDLRTAAHEAAHIVQQRAGIAPSGGVGKAGDSHEQHADAVADAVVAGQSAEALLDRYGSAGRASTDSGPVQMLIAMTGVQLQAPLQNNDPRAGDFQAIALEIVTYNQLASDNNVAVATRIQGQLDQLRVLDRRCYAALDAMSGDQLELTNDPRAQILHQLLQESEAEHIQLVDQVAGDDQLRGQVDPFEAVTGDQDDLGQQEAKALWESVMAGNGKLVVAGPQQYQAQVRSWLTKLMDTKQGRRLLRYLDSGDQTDLGTNTYIGTQLNDLPPGARVQANNPNLKDPTESVAQPLKNVQTQATPSNRHRHRVNDAEEMNDSVLDGRKGVRVNGQGYDFGASSGSLVTITQPGTMRGVSGVERQNVNTNQTETPEIYQPDWILLGHELGHAANMKAGATTEGRIQMQNPTDVFSEHFTGEHDRETRQGQWYGGSEEYINIVGNENRLRSQGGLEERGAHTSPLGREIQRMQPQVIAALNEGAWRARVHARCPAEAQQYRNYLVQKNQLLTTLQQAPRTPNLVLQATQLRQGMVAFFNQQDQLRQQVIVLALQNFDEASWLPHLNLGHPWNATLRAEYLKARADLIDKLQLDPQHPTALASTQSMGQFGRAWLALVQAHDGAGTGKQFLYKGWWDKSKSSLHNIGDVVIQGDVGRYQRKLTRIVELTNDYA